MKFQFGLYPVITEEFCNGKSSIDVLKMVISAGVRIVQLREKNLTKKELYNLAVKYREITKKNRVTLIINDHIDIALAVKADGVHLGQNDLPCDVARKLSSKLIIGISTHNASDIENAIKEKATYINIGPIFNTNTKKTTVNPLGLGYLKNVSSTLKIPFTVMGGINKENIISVLEAGAKNIAMVTAITQAEDIIKTTKEFINIIEKYK